MDLLSLYSYVSNNPVVWNDPFGLQQRRISDPPVDLPELIEYICSQDPELCRPTPEDLEKEAWNDWGMCKDLLYWDSICDQKLEEDLKNLGKDACERNDGNKDLDEFRDAIGQEIEDGLGIPEDVDTRPNYDPPPRRLPPPPRRINPRDIPPRLRR